MPKAETKTEEKKEIKEEIKVKEKQVLKDIKDIEKLADKQWDTKIPKIIHYMWLGDRPKSEEIMQNIESWKKYNPDYEIIEWNDTNLDLNSCPFMTETCENKKYGFTADWVRLYGIKKYGGIWLDTDVEVIKPFGDLMNCDGFMSFENEVYIQSAVMAAKKDSEWINTLFKYYSVRHFVKKGKMDLTTLPVVQTILLHKFYGVKYKNKMQVIENQLTVLPNDYLAPKDYTTGEITITLNTITIHKFAASWFSKGAERLAKFLKGVRKVLGKKIFGWFTWCYIKNVEGRYLREYKKLVGKEK